MKTAGACKWVQHLTKRKPNIHTIPSELKILRLVNSIEVLFSRSQLTLWTSYWAHCASRRPASLFYYYMCYSHATAKSMCTTRTLCIRIERYNCCLFVVDARHLCVSETIHLTVCLCMASRFACPTDFICTHHFCFVGVLFFFSFSFAETFTCFNLCMHACKWCVLCRTGKAKERKKKCNTFPR